MKLGLLWRVREGHIGECSSLEFLGFGEGLFFCKSGPATIWEAFTLAFGAVDRLPCISIPMICVIVANAAPFIGRGR